MRHNPMLGVTVRIGNYGPGAIPMPRKLMKGTEEDTMIRRFFSALGSLAHACSEFGNYFMSFQHRCFKSGLSGDCEGNPTLREAQQDYREMLRSQKTTLIS